MLQSGVKKNAGVKIQGSLPVFHTLILVEVGSSQPQPVLSKPSVKVFPYSVPGGTNNNPLAQLQSVHVLHTHMYSRDGGDIGGEREKKGGKPQDIRGRGHGERQAGRPGGLCFLLRVVELSMC